MSFEKNTIYKSVDHDSFPLWGIKGVESRTWIPIPNTFRIRDRGKQ
jgi:hypothetical protein